MIIREFVKEDYEEIQKLLLEEDMIPLPSYPDLGGYAMVVEDKDSLVGFVWSLIAPDSTYALIEYFVVRQKYRAANDTCSALLMTKMLIELMKMGKDRIVGVIKERSPKSDSLARAYRFAGMDIAPAYVVSGSAKPLCDNMRQRFLKKAAVV